MKFNNSDEIILNTSLSFKFGSLLLSIVCLIGAWIFFHFYKETKSISIFFVVAAIIVLIDCFRRKVILNEKNVIDLNHIFSTKTYNFNRIDQYSFINSYTLLGGRGDSWNKSVDIIFYNNKNEIGSIDLSAFNKESIKTIDEFLNKNICKINQIKS